VFGEDRDFGRAKRDSGREREKDRGDEGEAARLYLGRITNFSTMWWGWYDSFALRKPVTPMSCSRFT
jgi:hypothetical protein